MHHWHRRAVVCGGRTGSAWGMRETQKEIQGFVRGRAEKRAFLDIIFEMFVL